MKEAFIGALTAVLVLVTGFVVVMPSFVQEPLGASAGPEYFNRQIFRDQVVVGGSVFATTSRGTVTYTAASIANSRVINHVAEAALTANLPTKTALDAVGFIPNPGDTYTLFIYASTTLITVAGNTGVLLENASTTNNISALGSARLEFVRLPATEDRNIEVLMYSAE